MNAKAQSCDGENSEVKGDDSESTDEDDQTTFFNDDNSSHQIDVDKLTYFNDTSDEMTSGSVCYDSETRKRSPVWKYFIYRQTCAVCRLCRKSLKRGRGSTTNLLHHMKHVHCKQYQAILAEYSHRKAAAEMEARNEVLLSQ